MDVFMRGLFGPARPKREETRELWDSERLAAYAGGAAGAIGAPQLHEERAAWLKRAIEAEIIPRLMLANLSPATPVADGFEAGKVRPEHVAELTRVAIGPEASASIAYVRSLRAGGVPLERIYLDLLAPAARRLGALWEADLCDFTEVTLGLWRLQKVVHDIEPELPSPGSAVGERPLRVLITAAPGSQHTFGVVMVADFFRRAGWDVWSDPTISAADLSSRVSTEWFDVVGLSIGSECHIDALASTVKAARRGSCNKGLVVLVGGAVVNLHPDIVRRVGADGTAADAATAIETARRLVSTRSQIASS